MAGMAWCLYGCADCCTKPCAWPVSCLCGGPVLWAGEPPSFAGSGVHCLTCASEDALTEYDKAGVHACCCLECPMVLLWEACCARRPGSAFGRGQHSCVPLQWACQPWVYWFWKGYYALANRRKITPGQ